jgi:hypothetical protein
MDLDGTKISIRVLSLTALALIGSSTAASGEKLHFEKYTGPLAYALKIVPPWEDGGFLEINLPEHLERVPGGHGILRHNDRNSRGHWEVAPDGLSAALDAPSSTIPGVFVLGTAKVVSEERIELSMKITNKGDSSLDLPNPLYCHHYAFLTGFPQAAREPGDAPFDNFEYTYVFVHGKVKTLAAIPTRNPKTNRKGAIVRNCPQTEHRFAEQAGGYIEEGIDAAVAAVTSRDGKRNLVLAWTPGKSLLSNAYIPCLHTDPYYGEIAPGESRTAKGVILLTERPVKKVMHEVLADGLGTPPKISLKSSLRAAPEKRTIRIATTQPKTKSIDPRMQDPAQVLAEVDAGLDYLESLVDQADECH